MDIILLLLVYCTEILHVSPFTMSPFTINGNFFLTSSKLQHIWYRLHRLCVSLNVLKLYYKLCHGDLPVYITNLFTRIVPGSTHDYDLRPSGILKTPTVLTCVAERCVRFMLPKTINDADPSIIEKGYTHSFQGFTNYVKMIKIDSYATHCMIANCFICLHAWHTHKSNAYAQDL